MLQNKQRNNYNDFFIYSIREHTQFYANNITFLYHSDTVSVDRNGVDI